MSTAFEFMRDEEQLSLVNIGEFALCDVVGENCVTWLKSSPLFVVPKIYSAINEFLVVCIIPRGMFCNITCYLGIQESCSNSTVVLPR